jgi:hypothetical protein
MGTIAKVVSISPLVLLTACGDSMGPVFVEPRLDALTVRAVPFAYQSSWGLLVEGLLAEDEAGLAPDMRVRLRVATSRGDAEDIALRPRVCTTESGGAYLCGEFLFSMESGRHVDEVRPYLHQLNGALSFVGTAGSWASVQLFEGDADHGMNIVRRWPGVRSTSYNGLHFQGGPPMLHRPMVAVSWLDLGPPVRGDGNVQVQKGDTLTITYSPVGGAGLSASFVMCHESAGNIGTPITGLGDPPRCD